MDHFMNFSPFNSIPSQLGWGGWGGGDGDGTPMSPGIGAAQPRGWHLHGHIATAPSSEASAPGAKTKC